MCGMNANTSWKSIADGVWVRRWHRFDLTLGLVIGNESCLVIDTGADKNDGAILAEEIRALTDKPWDFVYTHDHFDHFLGTAGFTNIGDIWAAGSAESYQSSAEIQRHVWADFMVKQGKPEQAQVLRRTQVVAPTQRVANHVSLDLGDRIVNVHHFGKGHTNNDVVVEVPDAGVVFMGDLAENGAPPQFGDGFPTEWPTTVESALQLTPSIVVPGHGEVADIAWAHRQHADLLQLRTLCQRVREGSLPLETALPHSPWDEQTLQDAVMRLHSTS